MRETYVAPETPPTPRRGHRRGAPPRRTGGRIAAATMTDTAAIASSSVLLWLGAGTTVLTGDALPMSLAFAGGVVLGALSNTLRHGTGTRGAVSTALAGTLVLAGGLVVRITLAPSYFFAWVLLYAAAFVTARVALALVVDAFAGRARGAVPWRIGAIGAGVTMIVLLDVVWADSTVLADLAVFVLLQAVMAVLCELGIRSFRASRAAHE